MHIHKFTDSAVDLKHTSNRIIVTIKSECTKCTRVKYKQRKFRTLEELQRKLGI